MALDWLKLGLGQSSQCRKVSKDFIYWLATKFRDIAKFALLHFCNNNLIIYIVQKYKFENSDMSMLIGCLLFSGLIRAEEEPQAQFFASQAKLVFFVIRAGANLVGKGLSRRSIMCSC